MKVKGAPKYEVVLVGNGYRVVQETRKESGLFTLVPVLPTAFPTRAEAEKAARRLK